MKYNRCDEVLYKTALYSMKLAMAGTKIENVTFAKNRLHFIHKDAKMLKENAGELHFIILKSTQNYLILCINQKAEEGKL